MLRIGVRCYPSLENPCKQVFSSIIPRNSLSRQRSALAFCFAKPFRGAILRSKTLASKFSRLYYTRILIFIQSFCETSRKSARSKGLSSCREKQSTYSEFISGSRLNARATPRTENPAPVTKSKIRSSTSARTAGSLTIPFLLRFARPASNCGLTNTTHSVPSPHSEKSAGDKTHVAGDEVEGREHRRVQGSCVGVVEYRHPRVFRKLGREQIFAHVRRKHLRGAVSEHTVRKAPRTRPDVETGLARKREVEELDRGLKFVAAVADKSFLYDLHFVPLIHVEGRLDPPSVHERAPLFEIFRRLVSGGKFSGQIQELVRSHCFSSRPGFSPRISAATRSGVNPISAYCSSTLA